MSIGSFLFEGTTPPPKTTASSTSTQYPQWYTDYQKGLLAKADVLGAQPAPVYGGQRVAALQPQQQQAFNLASSSVGKYQPLLNEAQAGYESASNPNLNSDVFNSYKSPYINDVVNQIATLGNRNLMENVLPNVSDQFIRSGQFGSSPQGEFTARAIRDSDANVLNAQTQALQAAEEAAMSNYQTAMGRQMTGASNLAGLADTSQGIGLKDIGTLEAAGSEQQQQQQKNLDTAYSDWQEQTAYPRNTVDWISQVLNAQTPSAVTSNVSTQPAGYVNPSPLQSFLGTTAAFSGLKKGGLAKCKGGRMKYDMGGPVYPRALRVAPPPVPMTDDSRYGWIRNRSVQPMVSPPSPTGADPRYGWIRRPSIMPNARKGGLALCGA